MRQRSSGSIQGRAPSPSVATPIWSSSIRPSAGRSGRKTSTDPTTAPGKAGKCTGGRSTFCSAERSRSTTGSSSARRAAAAACRASWPLRSRTVRPYEWSRRADALLGNVHALDSLEAEQKLDPVDGWVGRDLLHDRSLGLLHVLAEADALDDEARQVDGHALVRLKHGIQMQRVAAPSTWITVPDTKLAR